MPTNIGHFHRYPAKKNAQQLLNQLMEGKGTKIWTLSADAQTYERTKNLLKGRFANSFTPEAINAQTLEQTLAHLPVKNSLDVVHDGSDIRKPYSKTLPHLTSVKNLDGDWVNGYNSFNSVVISDVNKEPRGRPRPLTAGPPVRLYPVFLWRPAV